MFHLAICLKKNFIFVVENEAVFLIFCQIWSLQSHKVYKISVFIIKFQSICIALKHEIKTVKYESYYSECSSNSHILNIGMEEKLKVPAL